MDHENSYAHGGTGDKFLNKTLHGLLDEQAAKHPDKAAHVFRYVDRSTVEKDSYTLSSKREVATFKDIASKSLLLASHLLKLGLDRGDRVAVIGECCPEWLYLEYAIMRVNMIMIRVPPTLVSRESMQILMTNHKCKVLVIGPGKANDMLDKIDTQTLPGIVTNSDEVIKQYAFDLKHVFLLQKPADGPKYSANKTVEDLISEATLDEQSVMAIQKEISPDDVGVVYATSGSEGFPKFPAYSHFGFVNLSAKLDYIFNCSNPNCVIYSDRPFSWVGSCQFLSIIFGITLAHCEATNTKIVYQIMDEEKVTSALTLGYILHDMLAFDKEGIPPPKTMQYSLIGGELVPKELLMFAATHFTRTNLVFGMSECFLAVMKKLTPSEITDDYYMPAAPYLEVKVVDDNNQIVPRNQPGVIHLRTLIMAKEYLDNPEQNTRAFLPNGWYNTGDIGKMNEKGELTIMGRKKTVISKGAIKIYPKEVETVLVRNPKVLKAAVIGVPDPRLFNEVCACIIPKAGCTFEEGELLQFCQDSFLDSALNFIPKYFWVMESFPTGRTGKIDHQGLIARAIEHFNLTPNM